MSGEELSIAYASSNIFLFPGALKAIGNVMLEAVVSGLPLIVDSDCLGHLVCDGVSDFACPSGDEDKFFNTTITLARSDRKIFWSLGIKYQSNLIQMDSWRQSTEPKQLTWYQKHFRTYQLD